jgi:cytidylate kinase
MPTPVQADSDALVVLAPVSVRLSERRCSVRELLAGQPCVITIDGPAGTGKSTVARALARELGLDFLDTGAMYRAAALLALRHGVPVDHTESLLPLVLAADIHFDWTVDPPRILLAGEDVHDLIRAPSVTAIVSPIAANPELRRHMVAKQRIIAFQHPRLVTEGRDQGSVAFPDAFMKFYLDASPEIRAHRRTEELRAKGERPDEPQVLADIIERDRSDSARADGALVRPRDAIVIDTGALDIAGVVGELTAAVRRKLEPGLRGD